MTVIDPAAPSATVADRILSHASPTLCSVLESAGIEGDVRPAAGWRLGHALRRAAAVVYAGGPVLGDLLVRHLRLAPEGVMSVPNGFESADIATLRDVPVRPERNGAPLDLVMSGYWYGRNGPGILLDALKCVGPAVAELTVIGGISPSIAAPLRRAIGRPHAPGIARSRRALYERLHHADAAVVTMDTASAVESRIPAKVYDYLATGVPVIAVCPPGAALLQIPEARRFHHVHHHDTPGLATLLRCARRDHGAATLHTLLLRRARRL